MLMMRINFDLNIRCDVVAAKLIDTNWYWVWCFSLRRPPLSLSPSLFPRERLSLLHSSLRMLFGNIRRWYFDLRITHVSTDRQLINSNDFQAVNRIFIDTLNYLERIFTKKLWDCESFSSCSQFRFQARVFCFRILFYSREAFCIFRAPNWNMKFLSAICFHTTYHTFIPNS